MPSLDGSLPDADDVEFYEEHGWWISPTILDNDLLDDASFDVERYYSGERDSVLPVETGTDWTPERGDVLRQNDYTSLQMEHLWRLVHHPLMAESAAILARTSEVRLFHDQLIHKPSATAAEVGTVGWHTDIAYWRTCSSDRMITAWIPFQDITPDMGPMKVLDRSHRWAGHDGLEFFHETSLASVEPHISPDSGGADEVPLIMRRGQVSFHHCRTIHGSASNVSGRPRVAIAVHMQDRDNAYRGRSRDGGGPTAHLNDLLCRKTPEGTPDYADPRIFPVLWKCSD